MSSVLLLRRSEHEPTSPARESIMFETSTFTYQLIYSDNSSPIGSPQLTPRDDRSSPVSQESTQSNNKPDPPSNEKYPPRPAVILAPPTRRSIPAGWVAFFISTP